MNDWYQPDERWPALGVRSRENYVQAYVLAGRFHPGVPADVVRAYETVSHLMAQAWYHYPLYDEALAKLLFLQEMAVKLRCQQLGISATFRSNGKRRQHTLQTYIDALAAAEPAKEVSALLHWARELRNHFAHPEWHGYAGGMFRPHMLPLLNGLNDLFVDDALAAEAAAHMAQLRRQRAGLGTGLLVLNMNGVNALLTDAQPLAARRVQGEWRVIWCFYLMIPHVLEVISQHQIRRPIVCVLTALEAGEEKLTGQDLKTGQAVQVRPIPAGHSEALRQPYEAAIRQASAEDYQIFELLQAVEVAEASQELRYAYFWN